MLALKGVLSLRFGTSEKKKLSGEKKREQRINFCRNSRLFDSTKAGVRVNPEFRLNSRFDSLPPYSEIFNQMVGIPVAIRGFYTIFQGALKTSADGSLVINLTGAPGTGKTSCALAIAATLSSLGTTCYYMSSEENPEDLNVRISSLIPEYIKSTSLHNKSLDSWFFPKKIDLTGVDTESFIERNILRIKELISEAKSSISDKDIPTVCPLVVVIDSITGLLDDEASNSYKNLEDFVSACRELGVLVILLSGVELHHANKLDYLVDTVIALMLKDTDKVTTKPRRILELLKSRQQSSRPGAHLFHIEGKKGFRVSPQLPSQMDKRQNERRYLPDPNSIIHAFNICNEKETTIVSKKPQYKNLDIYESSQLLLHGEGSSGKAALGLKILGMPVIRDHHLPEAPSRILVVSFLYPDEYYRKLLYSLNSLRKRIYNNLNANPELDCICFHPGFLTPEDFLGKVSRALEIAQLEGSPYTGILLDGLHNVFLQFPVLQESTMVWPMLYSFLSRNPVTTISTFTTFEVESDSSPRYDVRESAYNTKGEPFLHALVQASDFKIRIEPNNDPRHTHLHRIIVDNAINQTAPEEQLYWNNKELVIEVLGKTRSLFEHTSQ